MSDAVNFGTAVKPIEQMTKAELVEYVAALEAQRAAEAEERRRLQEQARGQQTAGAGYLITTPNPLYSGKPLGVAFERGQAFISLSREFPAFAPEVPTEEYYAKYGITPEQKAAMKARQLMPTATIVANKFRDDYLYDVRYFTPEQLDEVRQLQAVRDAEFRTALEAAKSAENAAKLMRPGYVGG